MSWISFVLGAAVVIGTRIQDVVGYTSPDADNCVDLNRPIPILAVHEAPHDTLKKTDRAQFPVPGLLHMLV